MQGRWAVALLAAALAAGHLAAPQAAATHLAPALLLNVVHARDLGCSDDASGADLRVSVFLDGRLALRTAQAPDRDEPWFGNAVAVSDPGRPVEVTVRVEEAEPGPYLVDTDWRLCDASPGTLDEFVATWTGGVQEYVARPDGLGGAEAIVVLGPAPAAVPVPAIDAAATATTLDLSWPAVAGTPRVATATAAFAAGTALPNGTTAHRVEDLCDGDWHRLRLNIVDHPWQVAGAARAVQTTDVAPQAARVLSAASSAEGWLVEWESRTTHDVARYEVLVGTDPAAPPATPRGSLAPFSDWSRQSTTVPAAAGDAHAWVRTVDRGGHAALSAPFALGGPAQSPSGQAPWTPLDPCTAGLATAPAADPQAPEVAADVFAAEAGHPASSPSPPSQSDGSLSSGAPPASGDDAASGASGTGGTTGGGQGLRDDAAAHGSSSGLDRDALGWMAVAVAGLAVFALGLVLVTRLLRR